MKILFFDRDLLEARPLTRFRSIFSVRDGIFSPLERARRAHPGAELFYYHSDAAYEAAMATSAALTSYRVAFPDSRPDQAELARVFDLVIDSKDYSPFALLDRIGARIGSDLVLCEIPSPATPPATVALVGSRENLFMHPSVQLLPGSVIDCSGGPVVLDEGVRVSPFSYLAGPLYVGPRARLDDARIGGGSILGREVRAGGEIENSIFGDFTNKHHEGFVGHSILGQWVNLGALTTTSDLKNNYGHVRLEIPADFYPSSVSPRQIVESGRIKFGALIGDCVKTAIGTLLNTGTVLDAGGNVFGGSPPKYLPPLAWGNQGELYQPERFLADCEKIFARRGEKPPALLADQARRLGRRIRRLRDRGIRIRPE